MAAPRFSTSVLGVWKHDQTLVWVFDTLLKVLCHKFYPTVLSSWWLLPEMTPTSMTRKWLSMPSWRGMVNIILGCGWFIFFVLHLMIEIYKHLHVSNCLFSKVCNRVLKWWCHKIMLLKLWDFQLFVTTCMYLNKVHTSKTWLFSALSSWDVGFWSSNFSILNSLI